MKVVWTDQALTRLVEIEDYIARDDPVAAERHLDELVSRGESLAEFAGRGRTVPELRGSGVLELIEGNYRIVYRVRNGNVEILTVFERHHLLPVDDLPTE